MAALSVGAGAGRRKPAADRHGVRAEFYGGAGSTTTTLNYNVGTNWSNPPAGAPPVGAGQSAVFDASLGGNVFVTAPVTPDSWTFTAAANTSAASGSAVNFSRAGPSGGIIDNSNSGQTLVISNNIGETVSGVQVQLLGHSTLSLLGNNTYSGGTTVSGFGVLAAYNSNAVGTGTVTLDNGEFQAVGELTFRNNFKINNTFNTIELVGFALTLAGNITDGSAGPGKLTFSGSFGNIVTLTGTNTYSGGTRISSGGALQVGDATHTGSIVGAITNEGLFTVVNGNTSGITSITTDGGSTAFFGTNAAGTANLVNEHTGTTFFADASSAGSATISNRSGSVTLFGTPGGTDTSTAAKAIIDNNDAGTIFNALTNAGSAHITNRNGGGTDFGDSSSAASATIINNADGFTTFGHDGDGGQRHHHQQFPRRNRFQCLHHRPATRSSPPTMAARRISMITPPAATRSSSRRAPASSISPAA